MAGEGPLWGGRAEREAEAATGPWKGRGADSSGGDKGDRVMGVCEDLRPDRGRPEQGRLAHGRLSRRRLRRQATGPRAAGPWGRIQGEGDAAGKPWVRSPRASIRPAGSSGLPGRAARRGCPAEFSDGAAGPGCRKRLPGGAARRGAPQWAAGPKSGNGPAGPANGQNGQGAHGGRRKRAARAPGPTIISIPRKSGKGPKGTLPCR
jgi:hypothetical protein